MERPLSRVPLPHRSLDDRPAAKTNLADAVELAQDCGMALHEFDAHLEQAHLCGPPG